MKFCDTWNLLHKLQGWEKGSTEGKDETKIGQDMVIVDDERSVHGVHYTFDILKMIHNRKFEKIICVRKSRVFLLSEMLTGSR